MSSAHCQCRAAGAAAHPDGGGYCEAETRSLLLELRHLPPRLSAALVLRHYHGYTNREIAVVLGVSERTVGQRIADALSILRRRIGVSETI